ncbi:MAG: leucyl aminopeptidase [Chlamydiales bacterium]|nr:leucyl aminopeptidase [Chlamydiales bacterium]
MITIEYTNKMPDDQVLSLCDQDAKTLCKSKNKVLVVNSLDLLEKVLLASFTFDKYKSIKAPKLEKIVVVSDNPEELERQFSRKLAVIEGVHLAQSLTSEPANCLYPMAYAERVLELTQYGLEVEILDEEALQKIGMTALLAVSQGSGYKPCVACISWKVNDEQPIAVVGKGVCFDSGGVCLKPIAQQYQMKWDKAAAGTVVGLMQALAINKCPTNVVGIIGLVENMPDGKALKPGDVITTMSGQTIEIQDTDAEGRLVLADCMHYAQERFNPRMMIDLGTLTQETFASLGSAYAALYSDDVNLVKKLEAAAEVSGDALWRMPMGEYFAKQIESPVADMKNLGNEGWGENGAAAEFLKRFVKIKAWAHIDIAGVAWTKEGPTGYGVRLLEAFIHQCPWAF